MNTINKKINEGTHLEKSFFDELEVQYTRESEDLGITWDSNEDLRYWEAQAFFTEEEMD